MSDLFYSGKPLEVTLPSGSKVTIRETNGDDESTLSDLNNNQDGTYFAKYLANIITSRNPKTDAPYTFEDVLSWPLKDITYLAFKARVHSLGYTLTFSVGCSNCGKKIENVEEDLRIFDTDLSQASTEKSNIYQVTPYPLGDKIVITKTLSSGRQIRFSILTGNLSKKVLEEQMSNNNRNTDIALRAPQVKDGSNWVDIKRFSLFSSVEMREIRAAIKEVDGLFEPVAEYSCPHCKSPQAISVIGLPDFFFPAGI